MLTATALTQLSGEVIFQKALKDQTLQVIENSQYRWFTLGGSSVQAIMSKKQPQACLLAAPQTLLIFLLWQNSAKNILNLGLGSGGLERTLTYHHSFEITAVEQQPEIIEMAKNYFNLPSDIIVIADCANTFLTKNKETFDVVLCDIYHQEQSPKVLFTESFYQKISISLKPKGSALISISVDGEQKLIALIAMLKTLHLNLAFIDFSDYKHIIIIISKSPLPDKYHLIELNQQVMKSLHIDFSSQIERMHFIPKNC